MNPVRKQRLIVVMIIVVASSAVAALVGYAVGNMGDYFYSVSQVVKGEAPRERSIRAGGCVIPGSIKNATDKLETTFEITDGVENMTVTFDGILPDLFGEGEAAVVTGKLDDNNVLVATKVLAKHDETYTPKEVEDSVQNPNNHSKACEGMTYDS
ncbi:cytochrome c maturation protein CcmE [Marinagarivorans algicola]|uniref:cytochrome c maturation protein CcmE n=1 Tax=Marinagarivorans algicola TaxID=1513270 RepID=UPI0006B46482|nr:cytochrome c maturation protein CcmE [Marinagarivorans algicola]